MIAVPAETILLPTRSELFEEWIRIRNEQHDRTYSLTCDTGYPL